MLISLLFFSLLQQTHTHTHTLSLSPSLSHTHSLSLSLSHTHTLSLSLTHTLSLSLSLSQQYIGWSHSYNAALSAALRMPHYRTRAKGIARERGLLDRKKKGVLKVRDKETCGTMCLLMNQVEFLMNQVEFVNESGRVC